MSEKNELNSEYSGRANFQFHYEEYAHYLKDSDMSEERKKEFLEAMWNIITEFVSIGFDSHPVQQAQKERAGISKRTSQS